MARRRTNMVGLLIHATPSGKCASTRVNQCLIAFSKGEATEEDLQIIAAFKVLLKDKRLEAKRFFKNDIVETITVFGKVMNLTMADIEEYKRFQKGLEAPKDNHLYPEFF